MKYQNRSLDSGISRLLLIAAAIVIPFPVAAAGPAEAAVPLQAGIARIEITDRDVAPVNDPCYAKALVLKHGGTTVVLITVDAVAIGEIGRIGNGFLAKVRGDLEKDLGIPPSSVVVNASHCHGIVRVDTAELVGADGEARRRRV